MNNIMSQFQTKAELECEANLAEFVRYSREDITWTDDDPRLQLGITKMAWPCVGQRQLWGKGRLSHESEQLDPEFIEFAKAYYRYKSSHSPTTARTDKYALKALEAALVELTKSGSLRGLSLQVLDEAAVVIRRHYSLAPRYAIGRKLRDIAVFVSEKKLISVDVSAWKPPFKQEPSGRRTGSTGRQDIDRKLPTQAGLNAMAEIFANDSVNPPERFVSAVWALLISAPWRIGEVSKLHVDAEFEGPDDRGVPFLRLSILWRQGLSA